MRILSNDKQSLPRYQTNFKSIRSDLGEKLIEEATKTGNPTNLNKVLKISQRMRSDRRYELGLMEGHSKNMQIVVIDNCDCVTLTGERIASTFNDIYKQVKFYAKYIKKLPTDHIEGDKMKRLGNEARAFFTPYGDWVDPAQPKSINWTMIG